MLRHLSLITLLAAPLAAHDAEWPEITQNHRPLVRWWWPADLPVGDGPVPELEQIAAAGYGGVELRPAPAVHGGPGSELEWLSPAWIERYSESSKAAERLGLKFDLSCNGPAPGNLPAIPPYETAFESIPITATTRGGPVEIDLPGGSIDCLGAWPPHGPPVDLMPFIDTESHRLQWEAPPGNWKIYGIGREAKEYPDHFSTTTATNSLAGFAKAFMSSDAPFPRAHTLESDQLDADWSSALIPEFQRRRGYDLREQLPTLFGDADVGKVERVLSDYRETLADLRRDSLITWHKWTHQQETLSRIHLKGVVGNPIDLHGVPDIPGTIFTGLPSDDDLPLLAFAASAAHLHTKPLIAATALHDVDDPSRITPAQMKETADLLWLGGANQLILDGILSGPTEELRQAVNNPPITPLGTGSGREKNIRAFNAYLTRCQSILQSGAPDPDVLLYYPSHDLFTERGGVPEDPEKQSHWFRPTSFHRTAQAFIDNGVSCDYVSDLALQNATVSHGNIIVGGLTYKTLILPEVRQLPEDTAMRILELTQRGAKISVLGNWPRDVPGFPMPDIRRGTLFTTYQSIPDSQLIEGDDPIELVRELGIVPEAMSLRGLRFVRRSHANGRHYFIVNRTKRRIDDWIPISTPATSAVLMDPRFLKRSGIANSRQQDGRFEVRLVLEPGESRILRTFTTLQAEGPSWRKLTPSGYPRTIGGTWKVEFIEGGPELPDEFETPILGSWTTLSDPRVARFSGTTRYSIDVRITSDGNWLLDLGHVADSARVYINGHDAGSVFAPPHQLDLSRFLKAGNNTLAIEVTNLRQPSRDSKRVSLTSGLLGPVRLIPLNSD